MDRSAAVRRINEGLGFREVGNPLEPFIINRLVEAQRDLEKGKTLPKFLLQEKQTLVLPAGASVVPLPTGFLRDWDEEPMRFQVAAGGKMQFLERKMYRDAVEGIGLRGVSSAVEEVITPWLNGANYGVGVQALDMADNSVWRVVVAHVSAAAGTFAADRAGAAAGKWTPGTRRTRANVRMPRVYVILRSTIDFIAPADREYRFLWSWYRAGQSLLSDIENEWLGGAPEWMIGEAGYRIAADLRDKDAMVIFDEIRTKGRQSVIGDQFALDESGGMFEMGGGL